MIKIEIPYIEFGYQAPYVSSRQTVLGNPAQIQSVIAAHLRQQAVRFSRVYFLRLPHDDVLMRQMDLSKLTDRTTRAEAFGRETGLPFEIKLAKQPVNDEVIYWITPDVSERWPVTKASAGLSRLRLIKATLKAFPELDIRYEQPWQRLVFFVKNDVPVSDRLLTAGGLPAEILKTARNGNVVIKGDVPDVFYSGISVTVSETNTELEKVMEAIRCVCIRLLRKLNSYTSKRIRIDGAGAG